MRYIATLNQLLVFVNLESYIVVLISQEKKSIRTNVIVTAVNGTAITDIGAGKFKWLVSTE